MVLEKALAKIQDKIDELAPTLELFLEESIQPSVADCERLQALLNQLEEHLAVYKYHKNDKELSPSFNLHAKVSEVISEPQNRSEEITEIIISTEEVPILDSINEVVVTVEPEQRSVETTSTSSFGPLSIAINDKFRFINELFRQNASEYNIAMEQLNTLNSWIDSEIYIDSLRGIYGWREESDVYKRLCFLVKKRFS